MPSQGSMPLMTSSLADAVDPVPMKAMRVGAIDCVLGVKLWVSSFADFDARKLVREKTSLAARLRPSRSPNNSAVATRPPPL